MITCHVAPPLDEKQTRHKLKTGSLIIQRDNEIIAVSVTEYTHFIVLPVDCNQSKTRLFTVAAAESDLRKTVRI